MYVTINFICIRILLILWWNFKIPRSLRYFKGIIVQRGLVGVERDNMLYCFFKAIYLIKTARTPFANVNAAKFLLFFKTQSIHY